MFPNLVKYFTYNSPNYFLHIRKSFNICEHSTRKRFYFSCYDNFLKCNYIISNSNKAAQSYFPNNASCQNMFQISPFHDDPFLTSRRQNIFRGCSTPYKVLNLLEHTNGQPLPFSLMRKGRSQKFRKDLEETTAKVKEKFEEIIEKDRIWTIPNLLCISRIAISPVLCYYVLSSSYPAALGILFFSGFTDLIDGMIARRFPSQASRLGSFLDPLADKILIASLFGTLTYVGLIPLPLTCLIISRDILIIFGASYIRYKSIPAPCTLSRYFDVTHATVQLTPTLISKVNTAIQLGLTTASLAFPIFDLGDHYLLHTLWWITAVTTVSSGMSYILSKNTYQFVKRRKM